MLSINPNLTEAQVVNILRNTATDMGANGFDNTFGFGRLNAQAAIQQALPTIAGANILCTTNSNYTLSFIPANATVSWSVAPASYFATTNGASTSGTSGTATIRAASNFAGSATISFEIQGNCNTTIISRTIWVGYPGAPPGTLNGNITPSQGSIERYWLNPYTLAPGATSHTWLLPYNNQGCNPCWSIYSQGDPYNAWANVGQASGYVQVIGTNACGYGGAKVLFVTPQSGGGGTIQSVAYPNPATTQLTVEVSDPENNELKKIELIDSNQQIVYKTNTKESKITIPLEEIKKGVYYLHVNSRTISDQIRILVE
jgi:serine protease